VVAIALRAVAVLPVVDEVVEHGGVGERRGVAEIAAVVRGDRAQDAAHDLFRSRLRRVAGEVVTKKSGEDHTEPVIHCSSFCLGAAPI
jgi:hypothetical protein